MNVQLNQKFTMNPVDMNRPRSTFHYTPSHKTTFNAGKLVPIFCRTYYPGDTLSIDTSAFSRMLTPITPVMDSAFLDIYWFSIPRRLVQDHWVNFMGENTESAYVDPVEYNLPYLRAPEGGFPFGSILDHLGIPCGVSNIEVEASQARAYALVWNEWFRDQNIQDPVDVPMDDATVTANRTGNYRVDAARGLDLLPVNKFHDYFTSALIEPQKGDDVTIPMLGEAQVYGNGALRMQHYSPDIPNNPGIIYNKNGTGVGPFGSILGTYGDYTGSALQDGFIGVQSKESTEIYHNETGVYADLSGASIATINDLRMAFATQQYLETLARGGSRYTEQIRAFFGVTSPDARLQRPEYLGGKRIRVGMQQVLQTSATNDVSPQGNTAAYSLTSDVGSSFVTSFTEHCIVLGVCCVRTAQTYQFGIPVEFSRKDKFDFVSPPFYNIGNMPIYNKEIFAQGTSQDDEVFGFKEAWAELRDMPSMVTGSFRSNHPNSLDVWHYAEDYSTLPRLTDSTFIQQGAEAIDRTLSVQSVTADQFLADFRFDVTYVSELTRYSIPGLTRL